MKRKRADRVCVVCGAGFSPTFEDQRACGQQCGAKRAGRTLRAKGTPPALARQHRINAARRQERIERACADRFGALTPREVEIFSLGSSSGYNRGYTRGYAARKRSGEKKVGAA